MALFNWSDDYSVGMKTLDNQHINLFNILNELHESMKSGNDQGVCGLLLRKLLTYTREHFSMEERVLEAARCPNLERQRKQHREFTQRIADFLVVYETGQRALTVELLFFLRDWLLKHILREDKEYSAWLVERGAGIPMEQAGQPVGR